MANPVIPIVYGYLGDGWGKGLGRQGGLPLALAEHVPVILLSRMQYNGRWIETRRPRLERVQPNLFVMHDAMALRFSRVGKRLGPIAGAIDGQWIKEELARAGFDDYLYWLTDSNPSMLWGMNTSRMVYDCIDPCFDPAEQAAVDRQEFAAAQRAAMVFCTAETLLERLRPVNPNAYLLENACAMDTWEATRAKLKLPVLLENRPRPIVGYMGTFDCRVDVEKLFSVAKLLPGFTFALVGRVNADQESRVAALRKLPNVVMPGAVSYEEGHQYTAAFEIGLIPFLPGPAGDSINPVKMWMYLAAGKPVVANQLRECGRYPQFVVTADDAAEFATAIQQASADNGAERAAARTEFALKNRWEDRASEAIGRLRTVGLC